MIIDAILKINPNAKVVIRGSNIDTCEITWNDTEEISKEDIKAMIPVVEQEKADAERARKAREEADKEEFRRNNNIFEPGGG